MLTEATLAAFATLASTILQIQLAQFNALPDADKQAAAQNQAALLKPWVDLGLKCAALLEKLSQPKS